jgi:V-type H+-transporting ATPase subunit a
MESTMDLFRSEEMQLMQLMIPAETAHDTIYALGSVGLLQFKDLNAEKSAFQRTYANQVKRCDEMARKLRFFYEQVEKAGLIVASRASTEIVELDALEARLDELEKELLEINANSERLQRSYSELLELQLVLEKAGSFFDDAQHRASTAHFEPSAGNVIEAPLLAGESAAEPKSVRLGFVAGVIQQEKLLAFERLLFRATRGNMFLKSAPVGTVLDPTTGEKQEKSVFVVFFAGERARTKILKICEAFGANRYPFPEEPARQRQMYAEVTARLRELHTTIEAGERHREGVLQQLGLCLEDWAGQVKREKAIYHTLNKLSVDTSRKVLIAEAWCPVSGKQRVQEALRAATDSSNASVSTIFQPLVTYEQPPTYFRTNKVTHGFQEIVDAYGIARYREVNPAVFTIVTFPFLFAVMFGDFGHGLLMLLFATYMVMNEKSLGRQKLGEIFEMMFGGRYVILLMSIFSIYTGLIYNEAFSIPMSIFGSGHWGCPGNTAYTNRVEMHFEGNCEAAFADGLEPQDRGPYPFGIDPSWHGTRTELQFLNSVKMKMSIVIGVVQMNLGILLSLFNQRYFRDKLSTWCEFVPQMLFLNSLFGYLSLLIVGKWASGSTADLYHVLIYMFMSPGNVDCAQPDGAPPGCPENKMFSGQGQVQVLLLLIALVAVPWMLIPKPYILKKRWEQRQALIGHYGRVSPHDEDAESPGQRMAHSQHDEHEEFDFGEVAVHQMIHTIEFVLGAVSNTASYLRLWALSLAHSQLSAVFYDRVLMGALKANNAAALFIGFFVFWIATLGVLMVMETLSAFLHALRLHWVEFQNKFYHGDGYLFAPFSFAVIEKEEL